MPPVWVQQAFTARRVWLIASQQQRSLTEVAKAVVDRNAHTQLLALLLCLWRTCPAAILQPCMHAGHYTLEASTQRGVQALSGTMEGARSVAGSNSGFNLAQRDSLGGAVFSSNNEAYGPTPGRANAVKDGERRSVAFTNIAPNSAATAGSGYGVVASAAGEAAVVSGLSLVLRAVSLKWPPAVVCVVCVSVGCCSASVSQSRNQSTLPCAVPAPAGL